MRSILQRELDQVGGARAGHRIHDPTRVHPCEPSNLKPFTLYNVWAATIVHFGHNGFDNITTMAEEIKNRVRGIPLGLLGSMSMIMVIYYVIVLVLSMMQLYWDIDQCTTYSVAFASMGMRWAARGGPWRAQRALCCFYLMGSIICTIIESLSKEKRRMMVDHMSLAKKSLFEMDHDGQTHIL
jgi:hypothetical protein